jgi:hypothetical protein
MGAWSSALSSRGHRKAYRWPFLFCCALGYPFRVTPARPQDELHVRGFRRLNLSVLVLSLLCANTSSARQQQDLPPIPSHAQMRLERFLSDAAARTDEYFALFQDLTAEETKTIEIFRGANEVSRSRRIVSDLVVYQAQLDNASIAEYRDVREVDGAPIPGREDRVGKLIAQREAASSIRDELQRITRESTRYDLDRTISGLTISEGLPLQAWARALFAFKVVGTEQIEGRTAVVVDYQQSAPNSRFGFKFSLPSELGSAQPLYRGRLWIDIATAHLWRERREIAVTPVESAPQTPLVIQSIDFEYKASRFGAPLPSRIVFMSSLKFDKGPDKALHSVPDFRVTFEYGPFKRFTTTSTDELVASTPSDEAQPKGGTVAGPPSIVAPGPDTGPPAAPAPDLGPEFGPDAPESGLSYEQLSAAKQPAAPARPPVVVSTPSRRTTSPPPAPTAPRTLAPVPAVAAPTDPAPQPFGTEPRTIPPAGPPPVIRRPARRPPRAVQTVFEVGTAVPVPAALSSVPAQQAGATLSPPPPSPPPESSPSDTSSRKTWRPPPS